MPDIETVIKAWEIFRDSNPYEICSGREFRAIREPEYCMGQMIEDTIALLKEQEEKRTPKPIIHGYKEEYWGEEEICPDCGKKWLSEIIDTTHFCPGCGRAVKWDA